MTAFQDSFVGILAIIVGCALIGGAAMESPMIMGLVKVRLLIESFGKNATRGIIATMGAVSIALGLLIASGWRWHW
jgi:hypothetical protein